MSLVWWCFLILGLTVKFSSVWFLSISLVPIFCDRLNVYQLNNVVAKDVPHTFTVEYIVILLAV